MTACPRLSCKAPLKVDMEKDANAKSGLTKVKQWTSMTVPELLLAAVDRPLRKSISFGFCIRIHPTITKVNGMMMMIMMIKEK